MKNSDRRKPRKRCQRCQSHDIRHTSASPGDGRRMFVCGGCGNYWTDGRRGGYAKSREVTT